MSIVKKYKLIWVIAAIIILGGCSEIVGAYAANEKEEPSTEKVTKYTYGNASKTASEKTPVSDPSAKVTPDVSGVIFTGTKESTPAPAANTVDAVKTKKTTVTEIPTPKSAPAAKPAKAQEKKENVEEDVSTEEIIDDGRCVLQGYKKITFYTSRHNAKTASGRKVSESGVAAGRMYSFGTRIMIDWNNNGQPDDRIQVVTDRGSAVGNNKIDVWVPSRGDIPRAGVLNRKVWVVK
jgi:3D (Asp-Asp-Asp) domain-containing protein/uncharacterized protein YceK